MPKDISYIMILINQNVMNKETVAQEINHLIAREKSLYEVNIITHQNNHGKDSLHIFFNHTAHTCHLEVKCFMRRGLLVMEVQMPFYEGDLPIGISKALHTYRQDLSEIINKKSPDFQIRATDKQET